MRKYNVIWEILKKNKECEIEVLDKALYKRIKKAVTKEKDRDVKFKEQTDSMYVLVTTVLESGNMRFTLEVPVWRASISEM